MKLKILLNINFLFLEREIQSPNTMKLKKLIIINYSLKLEMKNQEVIFMLHIV